jgi:hypothetical protein
MIIYSALVTSISLIITETNTIFRIIETQVPSLLCPVRASGTSDSASRGREILKLLPQVITHHLTFSSLQMGAVHILKQTGRSNCEMEVR